MNALICDQKPRKKYLKSNWFLVQFFLRYFLKALNTNFRIRFCKTFNDCSLKSNIYQSTVWHTFPVNM